MNTERAQVGWGFWIWWVLATILGISVVVVLIDLVAGVVGEVASSIDPWMEFLFLIVVLGLVNAVVAGGAGAVVGASVGIAQWLVLRRQVSRAGWWVLASTVGFAVGHALGGVEALGLAVVGASVGIAQWLVLRRQISRAGWWVLASIVGQLVGGAATLLGGAGVRFVVGLALYGAITGGVMVWLLRQPALMELDPSQAAE